MIIDYLAAMAMLTVDYGQTSRIMEDRQFTERNPFLSRHPRRGEVNTDFLAGAAGVTLLHLTGHDRQVRWVALVEAGVVAHNAKLGIQVKF